MTDPKELAEQVALQVFPKRPEKRLELFQKVTHEQVYQKLTLAAIEARDREWRADLERRMEQMYASGLGVSGAVIEQMLKETP